jgi:hypothetical protein
MRTVGDGGMMGYGTMSHDGFIECCGERGKKGEDYILFYEPEAGIMAYHVRCWNQTADEGWHLNTEVSDDH